VCARVRAVPGSHPIVATAIRSQNHDQRSPNHDQRYIPRITTNVPRITTNVPQNTTNVPRITGPTFPESRPTNVPRITTNVPQITQVLRPLSLLVHSTCTLSARLFLISVSTCYTFHTGYGPTPQRVSLPPQSGLSQPLHGKLTQRNHQCKTCRYSIFF
jgi:hypothetical protein